MTPGRRGWIVLAILTLATAPVLAQHAPEHMQLHERFYSTWMQPDHPQISCCHNEDCKPAASRLVDGHWEARWNAADAWIPVPDEKVDQVRETPDGQSHMCGRVFSWGFQIFCFVRGGGV